MGIAVEPSRGPLIHALLEPEFVVLSPVNPRRWRRFREPFAPSGAKADLPDADLLRELLLKHRERLRAWVPEDVETRASRRLVESRRKTVDLQTQLPQQLTAALKEYFPQALRWAGDDLASPMACDLLRRWPTLAALQRVPAQTLRQCYRGPHCRRAERLEQRFQEIRPAVPLTRDRAVIETTALLVQTLARTLQTLAPSLERFDQEMARRCAAHPDADLFSSLLGSGAALAPRLLGVFGTGRSRFGRADEVQRLTGIAPVTQRSGQRCPVHWRWAAPTFMRQTLHQFAHHSLRYSGWARAYDALQRRRDKDHHAAVRALAFQWLRILWRCWQERTAYDETRSHRSLTQRGAPIAHELVTPEAA